MEPKPPFETTVLTALNALIHINSLVIPIAQHYVRHSGRVADGEEMAAELERYAHELADVARRANGTTVPDPIHDINPPPIRALRLTE